MGGLHRTAGKYDAEEKAKKPEEKADAASSDRAQLLNCLSDTEQHRSIDLDRWLDPSVTTGQPYTQLSLSWCFCADPSRGAMIARTASLRPKRTRARASRVAHRTRTRTQIDDEFTKKIVLANSGAGPHKPFILIKTLSLATNRKPLIKTFGELQSKLLKHIKSAMEHRTKPGEAPAGSLHHEEKFMSRNWPPAAGIPGQISAV